MDELVYVALAALFAAVIVEGLVLAGVMRQLGAVLLTVQPGAPRDVGGGPEVGTTVDLDGFDRDSGAVLAFVSPNCEPCEELRPALMELPEQHPSVAVVPVIAFGEDEERMRYAEKFDGLMPADLAHLYEQWEIPGTPYVVSLDRSGRVRAKGIVTRREQLTTMAELAEREAEVSEAPAADGNGLEEPASLPR
jgi:hypothetical protein